MARLYLVRHGRAAAGWDAHHDPGLDELGHEQARTAARTLEPLGPLAVLTSPMRRTRETAAPLAEAWGVTVREEPRVSEIPSPSEELEARAAWLREVMPRHWGELDEALRGWRDTVVETLAGISGNAVVFSHFIAINAAVGAATGDDRVIGFRPDNGSITVLDNAGGQLSLVRRGDQADTPVL